VSPHLPLSQSIFRLYSFTATAPSEVYTLSLHDALPIYTRTPSGSLVTRTGTTTTARNTPRESLANPALPASASTSRTQTGSPFADRKSTRLNSSHLVISYAVFCLKKKNPKTSRGGSAAP